MEIDSIPLIVGRRETDEYIRVHGKRSKAERLQWKKERLINICNSITSGRHSREMLIGRNDRNAFLLALSESAFFLLPSSHSPCNRFRCTSTDVNELTIENDDDYGRASGRRIEKGKEWLFFHLISVKTMHGLISLLFKKPLWKMEAQAR